MKHIKRKDLHPDTCYVGECRNATLAYWDGEEFLHFRYKWGERFIEEIKHPEDEAHYDVFYPQVAAADYAPATKELIDAVDRYREGYPTEQLLHVDNPTALEAITG